jgi:preprotein translocase subunit SecF
MINIIKYRYWYFAFSLLIIVPGVIFLLLGGLKAGIDFTGGTELTFQFKGQHPSATLDSQLRNAALVSAKLNEAEVVSASPFGGASSSNATYLLRIPNIGNDEQKLAAIEAPLYRAYGCANVVKQNPDGTYVTPLPQCSNVVLQLRNDVGPTIGQQIRSRAVIAVIVAAVFILLYISFAFRKVAHPFRYGTCAIIALLHDVLVVLGLFAIFGKVLGVTVDELFVTAVLTVIGFSVHDTIVIFDRIRENSIRRVGEPFELVVNNAILQSMTRSLNTSLTVLMTLTALLIFGGASIRVFVLTLLIGITSGTYSSIFNASPLLVVWENDELGIGRLLRRIFKKDQVRPTGRARAGVAGTR